MSPLSASFILLMISSLFITGMLSIETVSAQENPDPERLSHYNNLLLNAENPQEFEEARSWLNSYYRGRVTTNEEDVPRYTLPELLSADDGTAVTNAEMWRSQRRGEILEKFKEHVYGRVPDFDYELEFQVLSTDTQALNGLATRKQVSVLFHQEDSDLPSDLSIDLLIYFPNQAEGPVPALMGLNFFGNQTVHTDQGIRISEKWMRPNETFGIYNNRATEESRGVRSERWQVEKVLQRGYALVTAYSGDIEPDEYNRMREGVRYLAYDESDQPAPDEWGTIAAWAWGLSRMMDYLETEDRIDHEKVVLMGHSRLGKAALWAGATDERFSVVVSNNSGSGGAALSRRKFGETVGVINTSFPHWFARNFNQYNGAEEKLPVDQHMLLALIAPRPLYVASAEEDSWADPKGEFSSALEASPVYRLYGSDGLPATTQPDLHKPVMGTIGYHIRGGIHDVTAYDIEQFLNFADRHF